MFAWQKGYAAFSAGPSSIEAVRRYILNQDVKHKRKTFKDEYIELLRTAGIEYDERFLW